MEGAYFVGRKEVIDWVNSTCQLNLTKIEDTANGCAACMLLDQLHPGQVSMQRVNWNAKQSHEFVGNYKVLQTAFAKLKIDRYIDVDRLISGKYMDNLEFMQWFKRFYEIQRGSTAPPAGYDAVEARCKGKGGKEFTMATGGIKRSNTAPAPIAGDENYDAPVKALGVPQKESRPKAEAKKAPKAAAAATNEPASITVSNLRAAAAAAKEREPAAAQLAAAASGKEKGRKESTANAKGRAPSSAPHGRDAPGSPGASARMSSSAAIVANKALASEVQALTAANETMKNEMVGLEKERDFYFDKLRDIEILLQDMTEDGGASKKSAAEVALSGKIFKILYATAEGFVQSPTASANTAAAKSGRDSSSNNNYGEEEEEDAPMSPVKYGGPQSVYGGDGDGDGDDEVPPPPEGDDDDNYDA